MGDPVFCFVLLLHRKRREKKKKKNNKKKEATSTMLLLPPLFPCDLLLKAFLSSSFPSFLPTVFVIYQRSFVLTRRWFWVAKLGHLASRPYTETRMVFWGRPLNPLIFATLRCNSVLHQNYSALTWAAV